MTNFLVVLNINVLDNWFLPKFLWTEVAGGVNHSMKPSLYTFREISTSLYILELQKIGKC